MEDFSRFFEDPITQKSRIMLWQESQNWIQLMKKSILTWFKGRNSTFFHEQNFYYEKCASRQLVYGSSVRDHSFWRYPTVSTTRETENKLFKLKLKLLSTTRLSRHSQYCYKKTDLVQREYLFFGFKIETIHSLPVWQGCLMVWVPY